MTIKINEKYIQTSIWIRQDLHRIAKGKGINFRELMEKALLTVIPIDAIILEEQEFLRKRLEENEKKLRGEDETSDYRRN